MLDGFIIEELKRRERRQREDRRPSLELPLGDRRDDPKKPEKKDDERESDRGVIVIDL